MPATSFSIRTTVYSSSLACQGLRDRPATVNPPGLSKHLTEDQLCTPLRMLCALLMIIHGQGIMINSYSARHECVIHTHGFIYKQQFLEMPTVAHQGPNGSFPCQA